MKNIKDVELFVFDLDGTVYIGDTEIEGSFAAINELRAMGKRICFLPTIRRECTPTISQDSTTSACARMRTRFIQAVK